MIKRTKDLKDLNLEAKTETKPQDYSPAISEPSRYKYQSPTVGAAAATGEAKSDRSLEMANFSAELASLSGHYA